MSDFVPDFHDLEDDYDIPTSSGLPRPNKAVPGEEDIMELMWQNGQVVVQKSSKKSSFLSEPADEREIQPGIEDQQQQQQQRLFMQEDEMASWLHYPLDDSSFDRDFYADILHSAPPPPPPSVAIAPPVPRKPEISPRPHNFSHFSRIPIRPRAEPQSATAAGQSTVVESNVTPDIRPESRVPHTAAYSFPPVNTESGTSAAARDFSRKRKDKEVDDSESQSEDIEFEAVEAKKQAPGSSSTKRSRAAEVHNLSERRRRDRINEKMKALQELIPRCNKSDKASMLDEAIEYLKSLQMQVQMMSMGYGMIPMMYPGMQQYMPAMGMGMGMDMGMNRPIVPYPYMVQGSGIPNPAAAAHIGPIPMPAFHLPPVCLPNPSRIQASNQADPMLNSLVALNSNQPRMPNFVPYQQFLSLQQAQLPLQQNQVAGRTNADHSSTSKETGNQEHQQTGRK